MKAEVRDIIVAGGKWGLTVGLPVGFGLVVMAGAFPAGAVALSKIVEIAVGCLAGGTAVGLAGAAAWQGVRNHWGAIQAEVVGIIAADDGDDEAAAVASPASTTDEITKRLRVEHQHPVLVNQARGIVWGGAPMVFVHRAAEFCAIYYWDHVPEEQQPPDGPDAKAHQVAEIVMVLWMAGTYMVYAVPREAGMRLLSGIGDGICRLIPSRKEAGGDVAFDPADRASAVSQSSQGASVTARGLTTEAATLVVTAGDNGEGFVDSRGAEEAGGTLDTLPV